MRSFCLFIPCRQTRTPITRYSRSKVIPNELVNRKSLKTQTQVNKLQYSSSILNGHSTKEVLP